MSRFSGLGLGGSRINNDLFNVESGFDDLEKGRGKTAVIGEVRTMSGKPWVKTEKGWVPQHKYEAARQAQPEKKQPKVEEDDDNSGPPTTFGSDGKFIPSYKNLRAGDNIKHGTTYKHHVVVGKNEKGEVLVHPYGAEVDMDDPTKGAKVLNKEDYDKTFKDHVYIGNQPIGHALHFKKNLSETEKEISQFVSRKGFSIEPDDSGQLRISDRISPEVTSGPRYNDLVRKTKALAEEIKQKFGEDKVDVQLEIIDEWVDLKITEKKSKK